MLIHNKPLGTCAYLGGIVATPEQFCWDWGQMRQYNAEYMCQPGTYVHYDRATVSYHSQARNFLVQRFLGDWLMMLDADHGFEPDIVARMVSVMYQYDVQVLSALYYMKVHPHLPTIYQWADAAGGFLPIGKWTDTGAIFKIDCAGAGALLVRRSVFDRITKEMGQSPFHPISPWGEDFSFFRRLMLLGIPAYACPAIECQHLMTKGITSADYDPRGLPFVDKNTGETVKA
jgi:hypothetical protein